MKTTPKTDANTLGARIDRLSLVFSQNSPEGEFLRFLKNRWEQDSLTVRDWSAVSLIADRAQA